MRSKRQTIEGAKEGVTAHLAADFSEKYRGRFHLKMEVGGDPKNQGPFRQENWSGRIWRFVGAIACLGSSSRQKPALWRREPDKVVSGVGVAFGQRICTEAGRTIQCAASAPSSSPSIHNPISAARENDVGGYHKPKCVIADKGDLDKYPHDCKAHQNERERTSVLHPTSPTRRNRIKQTVPRFALQETFTRVIWVRKDQS
jgi:hypothetical protein